jgi:hypothetical protein
MRERKHGVKAQFLIRYGGFNVIMLDRREDGMGGTAPILSSTVAFSNESNPELHASEEFYDFAIRRSFPAQSNSPTSSSRSSSDTAVALKSLWTGIIAHNGGEAQAQ